jgi:hypothetical protein
MSQTRGVWIRGFWFGRVTNRREFKKKGAAGGCRKRRSKRIASLLLWWGLIRFMNREALHPDYPETKGCLGHFPSFVGPRSNELVRV